MQLSKNFKKEEFERSETAQKYMLDNSIKDEHILNNLRRLCDEHLERIRIYFGNRPIVITSGYRSKDVNRRAGGSQTSMHMKGCACDFYIKGLDMADVYGKLKDLTTDYDQLIYYPDKGFIHYGITDSPRHEAWIQK